MSIGSDYLKLFRDIINKSTYLRGQIAGELREYFLYTFSIDARRKWISNAAFELYFADYNLAGLSVSMGKRKNARGNAQRKRKNSIIMDKTSEKQRNVSIPQNVDLSCFS